MYLGQATWLGGKLELQGWNPWGKPAVATTHVTGTEDIATLAKSKSGLRPDPVKFEFRSSPRGFKLSQEESHAQNLTKKKKTRGML